MHVQYPLSDAKYARILAKAGKAGERRAKIKKRKGPEVERASAWCAIWLIALGIRQFEEREPKKEHS